jgi:hypothetical protein
MFSGACSFAQDVSRWNVLRVALMDNLFFGKNPVLQPSAKAPAPTVDSNKVLSVFSNGYTNVPMDTFRTSWSNGGLETFTVGGRDIKKYTDAVVIGMETGANQLNISSYDYVSIDIWSPVITKMGIKLVDFGVGASYGGDDDVEDQQLLTPINAGAWTTVKIPLSQFTGLTTKAHIAQILLVTNGPGGVSGTFFMDNFFFGKN